MVEQDSDQITEVQNTIDEFFRTFDNKEWNKCRSLLMDEVELNYSTPSERIFGRYSADDLIDKWRDALHRHKKSYRQRGKQIIEINGETASVSSRNYIFHRLEDCEEQEFWEIWGDYTHYLAWTAEGWKCSGIKLHIPSQSPNFDVKKFIPENKIKD
jgi:hypothetical protein